MIGLNLSGVGARASLFRHLPDDRGRGRGHRRRSFELGRGEDPAFTFRTMIVQAGWPGATLDDTLQQVTERLERKLQETPELDFLRSYTTPGGRRSSSTSRAATAAARCRTSGTRSARTSATSAAPSAGVVGPGFNDDFGDTFGIIYGFTADGFTSPRAARLRRGHPLATAAGARRVEDRNPRRAGRADLSSNSRPSSWPGSASTARR